MRARRWSSFGLIAAVMLCAAPAGAAESGAVGIRPAGEGPWFHLKAAPGETLRETALVINNDSRSIRLTVYAVDATLTPQGSFALREKAEPRTGFGAWTSVERQVLVMKPKTVVRIPFTVTVPKEAEPGDHDGGIVIERPLTKSEAAKIDPNLSVRFDLVQRVGVRAFLRVKGVPVTRLTLGPLRFKHMPGGIAFTQVVSNTGTVRVVPSGTLHLAGWRAGTTVIPLAGPELLLPGERATMTARWKGPPAFARVTATSRVGFADNPSQSRVASLWLVPWSLLAVIALGALLVLLLLRRVIRFVIRARRALQQIPGREGPVASQPETDDVLPARTLPLPTDVTEPAAAPSRPASVEAVAQTAVRTAPPEPHHAGELEPPPEAAAWLSFMFGEGTGDGPS